MKRPLLDTFRDPRKLSVRFQPIFHIKEGGSRVDSLEALIRGPLGTNFERADLLFDYVRRKKAETAVDQSCVVAIFDAISNLPSHFRVNINVHASTLGKDPSFADFFRTEAQKRSLALDRFTAEIVEHSPTYNVPALLYTIRRLRDSGIRIALDDVGLGHSNYRMMLDCRPDYFKLDAYFVRGLSTDPDRRAVVRSIVSFAKSMGGCVVAEGAESQECLVTLAKMGVELFQANLLCGALSIEGLRANSLLGASASVPLTTTTTEKRNVGRFEYQDQKLLV
ncbi:MAG TPA: EAL domain-containing protein [Terriglobales bacterium]|jgi:EAL domain-containing protein (putative c-di-GMP-specific phosphodiesterase class I)|nr:EAL domain-containing protein [Terriglobales bacterium]